MNKYQKRIDNLREILKKEGLEAFYINSNANVSYFTGKKGNDCSLYISEDEAFIITDFRYEEMAQSMSEWLTFYMTDASHSLMDFMKSRKEKVLAVERNFLPLNNYLAFTQQLEGVEIRPIGEIVEDLRAVKDEEELQLITKAAAISAETFNYILGVIKPGMTEKELATELEYQMRKRGAEGLAFDTIAISGKNTSLPHGVPTDKKIEVGDFITMDFGCKYNGYCSDMTRTVAVGNATEEMVKVYNTVLKAQLNACEKIHAGLTGQQCDDFARDIIKEAGYGDRFGHSLGHGVGLFIHENPRFRQGVNTIIPVNSVVSIEPGIYLPNKFGVRIEDLAIIKADGIINLVNSTKELVIL